MRSQRQLIADIVRRSHDHPTAEQICLRARRESPTLAVGTVYRNLRLLTADGELRSIEQPGMPARYDGNLSPHEHMVCLCCGELQDVHLEDDLLTFLRQSTGADVRSYSLRLGCICEKCAAAEGGEGENPG